MGVVAREVRGLVEPDRAVRRPAEEAVVDHHVEVELLPDPLAADKLFDYPLAVDLHVPGF
jgi:hypothetical protein